MQFENKPHEPDNIPTQFTASEIDWLSANKLRNTDHDHAFYEMLCKMMQARRDAVGESLPKSVAELPLMPDISDSQATLFWALTMGELSDIEDGDRNADRSESHSIPVKLTRQELRMIGTVAALTLDVTATFDPFAPLDVAFYEEFAGKRYTPEDIETQHAVEFDLELIDEEMATGLMLAVVTYWQENQA